jgi:holo-[acyl-carrier protein] synthase
MIGIDITTISRFKNKNKKFLKRVLHSNELKEYLNLEEKNKYLAIRWAIKEALFKIDKNLFDFSKIEIIKKNKIYTFKNYFISTSQENDLLIAVVKKDYNE